MNEEPIYQYVKGSGWVPGKHHYSHDGRYRLELRKPNPGEYSCWHNVNWSLEEWVKWSVDSHPFTYDEMERDLIGTYGNKFWCTFVIV